MLPDLLQRHYDGTPNYNVRLITSASTADGRLLRELLKSCSITLEEPNSFTSLRATGPQTPWGAELVTPDYSVNSLGVSMNDVLTLANDSPASEVTLILDCCFSGDLATSQDCNPLGYRMNSRPAAPSFGRA